MIKKLLLLTLSSLLICSCSSANIDSNDDSTNPTNNDSGYVEPLKEDPYPISNEKLNQITNAFYQQSFAEKGIDDDSSFCGFYEPRLININSFLPLYNYGMYNSTYVITFAINGFYGRADSYYSIEIKDGKLSLSMKALEEIAATEITEEKIEYESDGEATTSMADLLKKAGF